MTSGPGPDSAEARLDLGELQQVLQDEELARKMQEDEENHLRRVEDAGFSHIASHRKELLTSKVSPVARIPSPLRLPVTQRATSEWHKWLRTRCDGRN